MKAAIRGTEADSWRDRLSRQLAALTVALTVLAFVPLMLATSTSTLRMVLLGAGLIIGLGLLAVARPQASAKSRSMVVVLAFLAIGTIGFATVGFLSGPGVGFAAAVSFAGLLLGRPAMYITVTVAVVAGIAVAVAMVHGVIPLPELADTSPALGTVWIRSLVIMFILIVILAAAILQVVERIERALLQVESESRKRYEMELQVAHGQSMQLIAQLAASLAHDVNNQLTVIAAWSDIADTAETADQRRHATDAIHGAIAHAATLTRQMLMLARRDAPTPRELSVSSFLTKNAAMLAFVTHKNIELTVEADTHAWCRIDDSQLSQILINLAMNACDAMESGGRLSIQAALRRDPTDVGIAGAIPKGDWVVLSVHDTGPGMTEEAKMRAFEPFFTTKRPGEGTGLGLATIAVIVDQAQGHVSLDSAPGPGTTVSIWLPAIAPADEEAVKPGRPSSRLDGLRVLLVDDTAAVLDVARRALVQAGATVSTASDGDEALAAVRSQRFDFLCTDVVMPGAPVPLVVDEFRDRNTASAVLLCSGYVGETLLRHGIKEGRYELLNKPYTAEGLVEAVGHQWHTATAEV